MIFDKILGNAKIKSKINLELYKLGCFSLTKYIISITLEENREPV